MSLIGATASLSLDSSDMKTIDDSLAILVHKSGGDRGKLLFFFFSFMHRRTDFNVVPKDEDVRSGKNTIGFLESDAEKILLASFRQFPLGRAPSQGGRQNPSTAQPKVHNRRKWLPSFPQGRMNKQSNPKVFFTGTCKDFRVVGLDHRNVRQISPLNKWVHTF